jgi:hypothetical protein
MRQNLDHAVVPAGRIECGTDQQRPGRGHLAAGGGIDSAPGNDRAGGDAFVTAAVLPQPNADLGPGTNALDGGADPVIGGPGQISRSGGKLNAKKDRNIGAGREVLRRI